MERLRRSLATSPLIVLLRLSGRAVLVLAFHGSRNPIAFRQPVVQIDQFATLAAKGPKRVTRPGNVFVANGTSHGQGLGGSWHCRRLNLDQSRPGRRRRVRNRPLGKGSCLQARYQIVVPRCRDGGPAEFPGPGFRPLKIVDQHLTINSRGLRFQSALEEQFCFFGAALHKDREGAADSLPELAS